MPNRARPVLNQRPFTAVLWGLLLALLLGVLTFERAAWKSLIGDEATYLMAAESLAWDRDLQFEAHDYRRFVEHWQMPPEGLILQSGDRGEHITFGKPFFYPLWVAPFARIWPTGGPFLANFVVLALAAVLATRTLAQSVGQVAPLWVACCLFGSVVFAYTFWAHADLFLLAITAIALSLAFRMPQQGRPVAGWWLWLRWIGVGALLAMVAYSRPFYLPLFIPVALALPRQRRWSAAVALLVGAAGLATVAATVHRSSGDAWTSYGAQRRGFYSETGFPGVDFPVTEWTSSLDHLGDAAWAEARSLLEPPPTSASLWSWNSVYFLLGRHIGVIPYFLPVLLGLFGRPCGSARWMLLVAVLLSIAGFFLYRPFNIYGGGGAIANRYFMPLFPAFWFLATRPCWPRRIIAVTLAASPFLWPLWAAPRSFPMRDNHTYRYVSNLAVRLLPFETTQSHLKPAGRSDVTLGNLWVKFLSPDLRAKRDGSGLLLDRGGRGELLVGSYQPLSGLELQVLEDPAETVGVVGGAEVVKEEPNRRGRRLELELSRRRARHPMWWTWEPFYLYQIELVSTSVAAGRVTFTLRPLAVTGASPP